MTAWLLLLWVFSVWMLWVMAVAAQKAVEDAEGGIPQENRRGTSWLPMIPLFPLTFWGAALLIDLAFPIWGTWAIASLHGLYAVVLLGSIVRNRQRLLRVGREE